MSCFAMTEPEVAGSDPTLIQTRAVREGDDWVANGHKWFISNARRASFAILIARTEEHPERPQAANTGFIVDLPSPGWTRVREVETMHGGSGHSEIVIEDLRVPNSNMLGGRGQGHLLGQYRLGPARLAHCMRWVAQAETALDMMVERSLNLVIGGGIRVQDAVFFLSGLLGEEQSSARVWQVTKDNWTKIKAMWPEAMVGRLYGSLGVLDTPEEEADVKAFFDANPVETTKMQLAQGLEKLRINVRLRQSVSAGETALMQYLVPSGQQGCIPPSVKDGGKGVDSAEDAAPAPAAQAPSDASPAVSSEAAPAAAPEKSDK